MIDPSIWTVRPVAEVFYENEFGRTETLSGLVGLIYRARDNLSFDVAVRHALTNGHPVNEIRAGLTFGFPLSSIESHAAASPSDEHSSKRSQHRTWGE